MCLVSLGKDTNGESTHEDSPNDSKLESPVNSQRSFILRLILLRLDALRGEVNIHATSSTISTRDVVGVFVGNVKSLNVGTGESDVLLS